MSSENRWPNRRRTGGSGASWPLLFQIAARFLRGRGSRLLNGTARAALIATALGVMAMVIAMALMSGYRRDLREKLSSGSAALLVYPLFGRSTADLPVELSELRQMKGVAEVARVVLAQGALASDDRPDGFEVTLRGVELEEGVLRFNRRIDPQGVEYGAGGAGLNGVGVLLGSELMKRLEVEPGSSLRLTALGVKSGRPRFAFKTVTSIGAFATGFSEFDRSWVVIERGALDRLVGGDGLSDLLEVSVEPGSDGSSIARQIEDLLGDEYLVSDSSLHNRELFAALRWQQSLLFLVLGLIVLVSTFNVAATVVVLVRERVREIGVLSAMGLPATGLRWVFLLYALGLTVTGTAVGLALGAGVSWTLNRFELIRFDSEVAAVYFVDSVQFDLRWLDLTSIVGFTLVTSLAACWIPASRAARIEPSAALRHE